MSRLGKSLIFAALMLAVWTVPISAADLYIGTASIDITPERSAVLAGQFHPRPSRGVQYPLKANILALETREGETTLDKVMFVAVDTAVLRGVCLLAIQNAFVQAVPEVPLDNVIFSATHTHTAPTANPFEYPEVEGTMTVDEYVSFLSEKIAAGSKAAWESRRKGSYSYGLGHAVVAYNRRAVYADGHAVMYGNTNDPEFRCIEGVEDHDVGVLFFWDEAGTPIASIVNVCCPSQEVEGIYLASADYWGSIRENLQAKFGDDFVTVGLCGCAGDLSPHIRYREAVEERMRNLRGLDSLQEIGRRVSNAVEEVYDAVEQDKQSAITLRCRTETLDLPKRLVTEEEYKACMEEWEKRKNDPNDGMAAWNERIARRYEEQQTNPHPTFKSPVSVVRIGDCALCTNQFEMYTDFSIQIKARSQAGMTLTVQLANGAKEPAPPEEDDMNYRDWESASGGTYLPSERAVRGGGYGAIIQSNTVGPEAGQMIVEESLRMINEIWAE